MTSSSTSSEAVRSNFLEFFRAHDHRVLPSASLIPSDPTLLLNVAGMVPFKPYFLGEAKPPHTRLTTTQKCIRTNDIENVGRTTRHLTFFEMLGNFSFGDYFKREVIPWAWELSTKPLEEGGWGFEPERIWVSVFKEDDEAAEIWLNSTDLPKERLVRMGPADNFWSTGGAGPCGPCTELYYDRGPDHGAEGGPEVDENRYIEFWNLVFMQYERSDGGDPELYGTDVIVGNLPAPSVDTGAGLERVAMLKQDVANVYETDLLRPMLDTAIDLTACRYHGAEEESQEGYEIDVALRVIAEHSRASAFLISDGVLPSNEGRGYVLRRLLRRIVRSARHLGFDGQMMTPMMASVIDTLGTPWPDLKKQAELITRVAQAEEDTFSRTLQSGLTMLNTEIERTKASGETALNAESAFTLHDTYGFPVDLTVEIAEEAGLTLDRDAFAEHMEAQRARARAATKDQRIAGTTDIAKRVASTSGFNEFLRDVTEADSQLSAIIAGDDLLGEVEEGAEVTIVLASTPFYAMGGGQLGDHGVITTPNGRFRVTDTTSPADGLIWHHGVVEAGTLRVRDDVHAAIDTKRRSSISRGHTATHILHATIKQVLGDHATQAGSAIDQGRFRFDFPHFSSVDREQLTAIQAMVNERIIANDTVETDIMSQEEARKAGATALFGEKYGDQVRVVRIGDYSFELCGGTHVHSVSEIGLFTILSEGSIANNVRRIEALTGTDAFSQLSTEALIADQVAKQLKVPLAQAPERIAEMLQRLAALEKQMAALRQSSVLSRIDQLIANGVSVTLANGEGATIVQTVLEAADHETMRSLATGVISKLSSGVAIVGTMSEDGKAMLLAAVSDDLVDAGVHAAEVLRPGAQIVGGGAGGRGPVAQAGGKNGAKLDEAISAAVNEAQHRLANAGA
ncbi:alanine--tRNA ligase [Stomatohabitans albus]|uniref:alanine--tRNA ligase n=1 Tax=Stomatohabitans albus TaxID=3110766 RepID=UPI00300C8026